MGYGQYYRQLQSQTRKNVRAYEQVVPATGKETTFTIQTWYQEDYAHAITIQEVSSEKSATE